MCGRGGGMSVPVLVTVLVTVFMTVVSGPVGAEEREIDFSGYSWTVKQSRRPQAPQGNYFSSSRRGVWVDELGRLHLRVYEHRNIWHSAEVINRDTLGYGHYLFQTEGALGTLDQNAILGLFTWAFEAEEHNREVDIEFGTWGGQLPTGNGQFVVQPYTVEGNIHRFTAPPEETLFTHVVAWLPQQVSFSTFRGTHGIDAWLAGEIPDSDRVAEWTHSGSHINGPGGSTVRINLYLYKGQAPSTEREIQIIVREFAFRPLAEGN